MTQWMNENSLEQHFRNLKSNMHDQTFSELKTFCVNTYMYEKCRESPTAYRFCRCYTAEELTYI